MPRAKNATGFDAIIGVVVIAWSFIYPFYQFYKYANFIKNAKQAEAEIISYNPKQSLARVGTPRTVHWHVLAYNGFKYKVKLGRALASGSKINIIYDPANPSNAMEGTKNMSGAQLMGSSYYYYWLILLMPMSAICILVFMLVTGKSRSRTDEAAAFKFGIAVMDGAYDMTGADTEKSAKVLAGKYKYLTKKQAIQAIEIAEGLDFKSDELAQECREGKNTPEKAAEELKKLIPGFSAGLYLKIMREKGKSR